MKKHYSGILLSIMLIGVSLQLSCENKERKFEFINAEVKLIDGNEYRPLSNREQFEISYCLVHSSKKEKMVSGDKIGDIQTVTEMDGVLIWVVYLSGSKIIFYNQKNNDIYSVPSNLLDTPFKTAGLLKDE